MTGTAPFPLQTFDTITSEAIAKRWIFKGIMARGETSAWIGPPGSLKSALLAETTIYAAHGADWRGKRCPNAVGVVYFAPERAELVKRRLFAHRQRLGLHDLPIAVVASSINLMTAATVPRLIATIRDAEDRMQQEVGLLIFDTFAKLIAAGGGDEDKAKDQGAVFANLQRLKEQQDAHVALIGHTGKNEARRARGSNALEGDADVMIQISGNGVRTASIVKANDLPEGPLFAFKSELHEFGADEEGDPVTVNVVSSEHCDVRLSSDKNGASASSDARLPKAARTALRALAEAIIEQGRAAPASSHIPGGVRTVPKEVWREQAYRRGISASDEQRARQQAFSRAFEKLVAVSRVGVWDQHVWLTK
jgi:hypothetical protein